LVRVSTVDDPEFVAWLELESYQDTAGALAAAKMAFTAHRLGLLTDAVAAKYTRGFKREYTN
jgi:hypothetical protein